MLRGDHGGIVGQVKCIICSSTHGRGVTMGPKSSKFDKHARKQQPKSDLPYIGVRKGEYYNIKNCTNLKVVATYSSQISGRPIIVLEHVCFFPLMFAANFPFQCSLGGLHTCCTLLALYPLDFCPYSI